jgi:hypothetical protein
LLQYALPEDEYAHCTMSSIDPRAQALYTRLGMQPLLPNFNLRWKRSTSSNLPASNIECLEGQTGDPAFMSWDAQIGGRERPADHTFWIQQQRAVPLWFRRHGKTLGYGYVRLGAGTLWYPQACTVGPIGVISAEYAADCALAATRYACARAEVVRIDVPGPHASLAPLLESGFMIVYVETFHSAATTPIFDARCYMPSGSDLL